jgi:hypothetical protein
MHPIGEVLSSRITSFVAEAWRSENTDDTGLLQAAPGFGSFLKCRSEEKQLSIFGVVYDIVTAPQDQLHRPTALRMSRAELKKEQPQIFLLLKTEWHVAVVGYRQAGACRSGLPPFPPQVHDFVYPLENEELLDVSENLEFLRMLNGVAGVPADELLAAAIRNAAQARHNEYQYLVNAGQQVSKLLHDDYDRLAAVLKKIRP